MYNEIFFILALLFIKHWYIDFVDQSMDEVNSKGNYGEWIGFRHSLKHGIGTFLVFFLDRKSTRLNSSHSQQSRMPSSA